MNQRKEPRAHSLLDLDLPRARLREGSFAGILSRDLRESRGNQVGEGHSQGWAEGAEPGWRDWKCTYKIKRRGRRSYDGQEAHTCSRERVDWHLQVCPRVRLPCQVSPIGRDEKIRLWRSSLRPTGTLIIQMRGTCSTGSRRAEKNLDI